MNLWHEITQSLYIFDVELKAFFPAQVTHLNWSHVNFISSKHLDNEVEFSWWMSQCKAHLLFNKSQKEQSQVQVSWHMVTINH